MDRWTQIVCAFSGWMSSARIFYRKDCRLKAEIARRLPYHPGSTLIEIRTPVQGTRVPIAVKVWPAVWQELAQAKLKWASVPQEAAV